jgi:SIR2-like domain
MSETVFILGAGASKVAGAPMMKDFLDVAEGLGRSGKAGDATDDFQLVQEGVAALQQAHSKASINLDNIESVFAAFEMAKLIGRLGGLRQDRVERLPVAMRRVIEHTIEETVQFPVSNNSIHPPPPYPQLAKLVREVISTPSSSPTPLTIFSVITFNYDLCVDYAFHSSGIPVGYRLDVWKENESLPLLKLHGSLNWGCCTSCKEIVPWPMTKFFQNRMYDLGARSSITLRVGSKMNEFLHCQGNKVDGPYVVPPTWNKMQYHESLERVWRAAAAELSTAENIFVCGYSLPDTDQFFKYLYALGTIGTARLKRFWVFNPDRSVEKNFRALLGQGVLPRFEFFPETFDSMFYKVRPVFGLTN